MAFLVSFLVSMVKYVLYLGVIVAGVFVGMKLRKRKDETKAAEKER